MYHTFFYLQKIIITNFIISIRGNMLTLKFELNLRSENVSKTFPPGFSRYPKEVIMSLFYWGAVAIYRYKYIQ